jgi:transcriptional regulator with XRE-family HTH domain
MDGMKLKLWRVKNKIKQITLARYLKCDQSSISKLENNYVAMDGNLYQEYLSFVERYEKGEVKI